MAEQILNSDMLLLAMEYQKTPTLQILPAFKAK